MSTGRTVNFKKGPALRRGIGGDIVVDDAFRDPEDSSMAEVFTVPARVGVEPLALCDALRPGQMTLQEMTEGLARGWGEQDSRACLMLQLELSGVQMDVDPARIRDAPAPECREVFAQTVLTMEPSPTPSKPQSLLVDDNLPRVRLLTINRPHRLNALDGPTLEALQHAVRSASESGRDVRVIVIRGAGRAFCAGSDLKWLADSGIIGDPAAHLRNQDRMQAAYEALEAAPQVVIGCVNGWAVAGGLELALACDILVADEEAQLGDEHLRKNLLPSGGSTQRLPRRIGLSRALYYLLTGRRMSGREAERIGLAALAVPGAELEAVTLGLAQEIAAVDPHALAAMKSTARRSPEVPLRDGLALERWAQFRYRNESPAMVAGVQAFAAGTRREEPPA